VKLLPLAKRMRNKKKLSSQFDENGWTLQFAPKLNEPDTQKHVGIQQ